MEERTAFANANGVRITANKKPHKRTFKFGDTGIVLLTRVERQFRILHQRIDILFCKSPPASARSRSNPKRVLIAREQ